MTKVGIGLPGQSIADIKASAEAASPYAFDSFSVYGDLGDLPPYAALHAAADTLAGSQIRSIGPMGVPVSMQHPEVIGMHSLALEQQLPGQSYVGLVRGAFLEKIGQTPATLSQLEAAVLTIREIHAARAARIPIYLGGFGPKLLALAGRLQVDSLKLGGTTNPLIAKKARDTIANGDVAIVMGAVSVVDNDRKAARELARHEVAKYLDVVGEFDPTLDEDERASLSLFSSRFQVEAEAHRSISDSLLDKFAIAGSPAEVVERIRAMHGVVHRFELGTPHGLSDRPSAIKYIGDTVLRELGE
jgi:5,10-methylenetetrahydromethanopterin reductase